VQVRCDARACLNLRRSSAPAAPALQGNAQRPYSRPMNTLRRRLCAAAGLACGLPAALRAQGAPAAPVLVKGQAFERQLQLAGSALVLNGTGVRTVAWFTGFVAGLYLTARASTAAQAVAMPGPKRLRMRLMHDVPTLELAKAFKKGVARNRWPRPTRSQAGAPDRALRARRHHRHRRPRAWPRRWAAALWARPWWWRTRPAAAARSGPREIKAAPDGYTCWAWPRSAPRRPTRPSTPRSPTTRSPTSRPSSTSRPRPT
jgi:hypothetical protein